MSAERERRLAWARGILSDTGQHSDARLRRACKTILNHSPRDQQLERRVAQNMLEALQPQPSKKETTQ